MDKTDTQRFKIVLPILKTRTEIRKDSKGNEMEVRFVQGVASSTDKDLHGDRMDASAIKSMADSLKFHEVPLNADHDTTWSAEIGPVKKLEVDEDNNLILEAELSQMSKANDLWYALTTQNKKLGLSIGGYVKEYEMVKEEELDEDGNPTGDSSWYRLYKDIDLDHVAVTSSPANPKTWVSAISKSIDPKRDLELIKTAESRKSSTTTDKKRNDKEIKALARKIARKVQEIEADLLLELTESILLRLDSDQIAKVAKYFDEILERKQSMDKKDVSLEAEEAKKLADSLSDPKAEKDENSAALENESSSEETSDGEGAEPTPPTPPTNDDADNSENEEEENDVEESTDSDEESSDDEVSDDKADGGEESEESDEEETEEDEADENSDESTQADSDQESTEKSNSGELVEVIKGLTENLKAVVKSNEELTKRIEELESQPAERKAIEISKNLGDDDSDEEQTAENLEKALEKEIAEAKEKYAQDPALFSILQRIRSKYALKAKGIK